MIDRNELDLLIDERYATKPDVIPNRPQRQILNAAKAKQLWRTTGGKVSVKGNGYRSAVNAAALEQCYFYRWLKDTGEHDIELTDAGEAARERRG